MTDGESQDQNQLLRLAKRSRKWLLSGAAALIIAILVLFRDTLIGEFIQEDKVGDKLRDAQGRPGLQLVRVEPYKLGDEAWRFVRPDGYQLSQDEEATARNLVDEQGRGGALLDELSKTAVPLEIATWRIYLRGDRNQGVRILDMRPFQLVRKPPLGGTLFDIPPQGGDEIELMGVDADSPRPLVRELLITPAGVEYFEFGKPYFEKKTLSLSDKEELILLFRIATTRFDVSLSLEMDYQVGDEKLRTVLDDNGAPFHVTARKCKNGHADYKYAYELATHDTFGAYPVDPQSLNCDGS